MTLIGLSDERLAVILKEYGTTLKRLQEDAQILKEWLWMQPHLPHTLDNLALQHILVRCKNSMERAKQTIDMHYTLKTALPEFFSERDPLQREIHFALNNTLLAVLPRLTHDGYRVLILKSLFKDAKGFNPIALFKLCFMGADVRLAENDDSIGDVILYDCEYLGMGHVSKITLPFVKKIEIVASKGYRARFKGIHFINAPPVADILLSMVKKVLRTKVAMRHHVHVNLETLYEHIDRDILPVEYGGNEKSVSVIAEEWKKKIIARRDWFIQQERSEKADEAKRPGKHFNSSELFGFEGTFKQLSVD